MEIKDRILIVEDDPSISNLLTAILKANSYQTMTAKTGAEAETLLASWCPDMVILDLGLPDIDGVAILKNLRTWSSMPVLVVSARTHERDKVEALDLGADDYPSEALSSWPGSAPRSATTALFLPGTRGPRAASSAQAP